MIETIPETIANFAFLTSGAAFAYIYFLRDARYITTIVWPYVIILFSALITATFVQMSKFSGKRLKFHQFYYLIFANICFLSAGILFWVFGTYNDQIFIIYILSVGIGVTHIAGLSYISIRTNKNERAARIGLSYFSFFLGFGITITVLDQANESYGIILTCCCIFVLIILALNEAAQWNKELHYDYKMCRDTDLNDLNNSGTIFEDKKVLQETSTVDMLNNNFHLGGWKSTNNLITEENHRDNNYGTIWLLFILALNLIGFVIFYQDFINSAITTVAQLINFSAFLFWILAAGSMFGAGLLFFIRTRYIFMSVIALCVAGFIPLLVFFWQDMANTTAVFFLILYFLFGLISSIPDTSIVELAKLKSVEICLWVGFLVKMLPIAILQYVNFIQEQSTNLKTNLTIHSIVVIVICVVAFLIVALHLPNTARRTLLEIQDYLRRNQNYTVLQKVKTLPVYPNRQYLQHEQFIDSQRHSQSPPTYATPQKLQPQVPQVSNHRYSQYPPPNVQSTSETSPQIPAIHDLRDLHDLRYNYNDVQSSNIFPRPTLSPTAYNSAAYRAMGDKFVK